MKVQVQVTEQDIKDGIRRSTTKCPYALAITRAFGRKSTHVSCGDDPQSGVFWQASLGVELNEKKDGWKAHLSFGLDKDSCQKANDFDYTGKMEPHSFEVEI